MTRYCFRPIWFLAFMVVFGLGKSASAQRKILVIPFDRFEFHTEIPLQTINEVNGLELDQFYPALIRTISDAFAFNGSKEITYRMIGESDYDKLKRYMDFKFDGKEGHFKCSLDRLHKSMYRQILDEYNCDYMLIMDWYRIMLKREHAKIDKVKVYESYTYHYFDFDIFNKDMNRTHWESHVKFEVEVSPENLRYHGVRLTDLRPVYQKVIDEVTQSILGK